MPTLIDLFAGAGGLSLGACRAGFSLLGAVEIDKHAIQTHARNFPNTYHIQEDVRNLTGTSIKNLLNVKQVDGIIGGPPCQGFSSMGHGDVGDIRNTLFVQFFRLVSEVHPKFFVAENVPGILKSKYNFIREQAFDLVKDYNVLEPLEISAQEYGAPTLRKRIFFIGYLPDKIHSITEEDIKNMKCSPSDEIHVKDALKGLPIKLNYEHFKNGEYKIKSACLKEMRESDSYFFQRVVGKLPYGVGDSSCVDKYLKRGIVTGLYPTKHSSEVIKRYADLPYGKQDPISKSQKLNPNGFCPTLRAGTGPEKGSYQAVRPIHYACPRVITPREAARLQGFPDWFSLPNTIWHSFRQIGNSVSPIVSEQILTAIISKL